MKITKLKRLLTSILGRGSERNKGDIWYKCPFCKHPRNKLSVNVNNEKWHCWHCDAKGRKLFVLLKKINVTKAILQQLNGILGEITYNTAEEKKVSDKMFDTILECMFQIWQGEEVFAATDYSHKEKLDFIDSLSHDQFEKIQQYFQTVL